MTRETNDDWPADEVAVAMTELRDPVIPARWPDGRAVRGRARRRRRTEIMVGSVTAVVVACAVAVPLVVTDQPHSPKTPMAQANLQIRARSGGAVELVALDQPVAPLDVAAEQRVAAAEQEHALALLRLLQKADHGNLVFSPSSLATALSMLDLGSGGDTAAQISALLGPPGSSPEQIAAGWSSLVADWAQVAARDKTSLTSANGVWLQQGALMVPKFMSALAEYFHAGVWQVDFKSDPAKAVAALNAWVDDQTRGHIPQLLTKNDVNQLLLVLVNAVYFDAKWTTPFSGPAEPTPFTLTDGSLTSVPTMNEVITAPVVSTPAVEAAELPYASGRFAALIIEPKTATLTDYVASLTPTVIAGVVTSLHSRRGGIQLPEFAFRSALDLRDPLKALGLTEAFDPSKADLSPMSPQADYVAFVKQKATIGVDETGTTATAATAIGVTPMSGRAPSQDAIVFDHPFLFLIRDTETGAILFAAKVLDPSQH